MKLTRRQVIALSILGLGLSALVIDRAFLAPQAAEASAEPVAEAALPNPAPTPPARRPESTEPGATGRPLSERLQQAVGGAPWNDQVPDALTPPAAWVKNAPIVGDGPVRPDPRAAEDFTQRHKLTSVMAVGTAEDRRPAAVVINGRVLRLGESLDGYTLTRIDSEGCEFSGPAGVARLVLPTPEPVPKSGR